VFLSPGIWWRRSFRGPARLRDAERAILPEPSLEWVESVDLTRVSSAEVWKAGEARFVGDGEYGKRSTWSELMDRTGRVGDFQWRFRRGRRVRRSGAMSGKSAAGSQ